MDPITRFLEARARAHAAGSADATAAALATADAAGRPSLRFVLVKEVDARGFVFYTNHGSRKARALAENPRAALTFYWPEIGEQVRVEGAVIRVDDAESNAYFAARPRASQIGAWASEQSQPISSREALLERVREIERAHEGKTVARPETWGGYRIVPERIEFWSQGDARLHDRELFTRLGETWTVVRLSP